MNVTRVGSNRRQFDCGGCETTLPSLAGRTGVQPVVVWEVDSTAYDVPVPTGSHYDAGDLEGRIRAPRASALVVILLTVAAFGPYLQRGSGLRTEQVAVYVLCILVLGLRLTKIRISAVLPALVPWLLFTVVAMVGAIGPQAPSIFREGSFLAGTDNLLLPIAVLIVIAGAVAVRDAEYLLEVAGRIIVVGAAVNALVALASTRTDLSFFLRPFWAQAGAATTVSESASQQGRFGGVFNQPAEAGTIYGLAALLAVYLYCRRPWILAIALTLISLGGILSVSKIFIFAGLPLALLYLIRTAVISGRAGALVATLSLVAMGPRAFGIGEWSGLASLERLFRPDAGQGIVDLYTAGRFSSGSGLLGVFDQVLSVSPIFGVGVSGWRVPYDSAWGESLVVAGLFGTVAVICTYAAIVFVAITLRGPTRDLALAISLFLVVASFGISSLTANRVASLVWVVVALLAMIRSGGFSRQNDNADVRRSDALERQPW